MIKLPNIQTRKIFKYDQFIQEVAKHIFDLEAYGSNEETSQAIYEAIHSCNNLDYIYMLLESDILKEINEINMNTVQP